MMDRDEAYRISLQQIRSGNISAACRTVADYELSQPQPRGLFSGVSLKNTGRDTLNRQTLKSWNLYFQKPSRHWAKSAMMI